MTFSRKPFTTHDVQRPYQEEPTQRPRRVLQPHTQKTAPNAAKSRLFAQIVLEISANRDMKDTVRPEAPAQHASRAVAPRSATGLTP
jgi:hypothetical protein